ncbi:AzlD family protein [uncultured Cohaesibacter sp.]|uniref:AzlD family protein n=1 Tax=uncultured Cohaesibacter sp. TaxID=1002546 RepID=UPI00292F088D|nr:AzlD family protein [uncultured Cohaesibacter sp.]
MSTALIVILGGAIVTYLTRIGGHLVLTRFERVHPRVQAGLDAVPAAVLTTLVAPAVLEGGPNEWAAFVIAVLAGLRVSIIWMVVIGTLSLIVLRQLTG